MALDEGDYQQNGLAFNADGALLVAVYDEGDADTYFTQNGFLLDADGRLVVTQVD